MVNPVKHPSETRDFGKPSDWIEELDGPCGYLSVSDQRDLLTGQNLMHSWWKPTDEERQMIADGAHIELRIYGNVHPVVSLALAPFLRRKEPSHD